MTDAYCRAAIITPKTLKQVVKTLFQQTNQETRLLTLNQLYQLIAKSCGFSSFQRLQRAPVIFVWVSEIIDLIKSVDESGDANISITEISNLFSCDIVCPENNRGIGVLVFNDNTVCEIPMLTEGKPCYANGLLYELPANRGVHLQSKNWRDFIHRLQQKIDSNDIGSNFIEEAVKFEWRATDCMDFDEIDLTDPITAYSQDLASLTEGQFRKLVCEQSVYSPASAVYELLDTDRG